MSERFEYIKGGAKDTTNEREYEEEEVVDLLNSLAEENKEQADTIKHLEEYCGDLEYDNKTLQKEKQEWEDRALKYIGIMRAEFTETQLRKYKDKL